MKKLSLKKDFFKAVKGLYEIFPLLLGTILLVSLTSLIPAKSYSLVFKGNFLDLLIGGTIGSISAGNPATSYILGGELLKQGVSLLAVTSFLVAWVTIGLVQLPAESIILGKKFAIIRNILSFIFAIIVALATVIIYGLI